MDKVLSVGSWSMRATNWDISRLRSPIVRCSHRPSRFLIAFRIVFRSGVLAWIFASCSCKSVRRRRSRVCCSVSDASESRRLTSRASSPVGIEMASIARSRLTKLSFSRDNSFRSVSPLSLMVRLRQAQPSPVNYDVRPCRDFSPLAYRSPILANTCNTLLIEAKYRRLCTHPSATLRSVGPATSVWLELEPIRADLPESSPLLRSKFTHLSKFVLLRFT